MCDNAYDQHDFIAMEAEILVQLEYKLKDTVPHIDPKARTNGFEYATVLSYIDGTFVCKSVRQLMGLAIRIRSSPILPLRAMKRRRDEEPHDVLCILRDERIDTSIIQKFYRTAKRRLPNMCGSDAMTQK